MEKEVKNKSIRLINETRVMTLAVSENDIPWSSPVYFVFHDNRFYFPSRSGEYSEPSITILVTPILVKKNS